MDSAPAGSRALAALAALALGLAAAAQDRPGPAVFSAADLEFFESKIRPLLIAECHECHASTSKRVKGELELDSHAALLRGGRSGAAIVPGDVEASELIA